MEAKNSTKKHKLESNEEEPPSKKSCQKLNNDEILPPSEDLTITKDAPSCSNSNKNETHASNNLEKPTIAAANDTPTRNDSSTEIVPDSNVSNETVLCQPASAEKPPGPSESIEEIVGIRLPSSSTSIEAGDNVPESSNPNEKKITWKNDSEFQDQGTHPITNETLNRLGKNSGGPQSSNDGNSSVRDRCAFGQDCYRKSSDHKKRFSHPGDADYDAQDDRPECPYGIKCYRKNYKHKSEYKHTIRRSLRAPRQVPTYDEYNSGSEEESVDESDFNESMLDESDDDESDWLEALE